LASKRVNDLLGGRLDLKTTIQNLYDHSSYSASLQSCFITTDEIALQV
jgi:hypothetical protein